MKGRGTTRNLGELEAMGMLLREAGKTLHDSLLACHVQCNRRSFMRPGSATTLVT